MTLVAGPGPLSARVTVKVTVSPTLGVGSSTVLLRDRSACWAVTVAEPVLLFRSGSDWSEWVMVAMFVCGVVLTTRAVIVKVWGVLVVTVPTVQTPVMGS